MNQSIIGDWLGLPGWQIFLSLAVAYLTSAAIIHWVCFHSGWRDQVHSFQGVVAPFMVSPGVIFALMLSFLASDVWARDRQALNDVLNERDAIRAVYDLSGVVGGAMPALRAATHDYVASVLRDEWPRMRHEHEAPTTSAALEKLLRLASDPGNAQQAGQATTAALLSAVLRIAAARSSRLSLSTDLADDYKWEAVLLLALLAQFAVAAVHLQRPRPQILALLVFTASAVTALDLVAICEDPFYGAHQISPAPLQDLLTGSMRLG